MEGHVLTEPEDNKGVIVSGKHCYRPGSNATTYPMCSCLFIRFYVALRNGSISCWPGTAHVQCSGVMVSKTMRPWLHEPDFRGRVNVAQSQTSLTCLQTPSQGLHPYEMGPGLEKNESKCNKLVQPFTRLWT